jgi:hypothetical protein
MEPPGILVYCGRHGVGIPTVIGCVEEDAAGAGVEDEGLDGGVLEDDTHILSPLVGSVESEDPDGHFTQLFFESGTPPSAHAKGFAVAAIEPSLQNIPVEPSLQYVHVVLYAA